MYFEDLASQCYATVTVLADGIECPEYSITSDGQGHLHCCVNLKPDQILTIRVALDMTAELFLVDFLADGVIRNNWHSSIKPVNPHRAETIFITEAIVKSQHKMYRCPLTTTRTIPTGYPVENFPRAEIGSISIDISKRDVERNTYFLDCKVPNQVADNEDIRDLAWPLFPVQPSMQIGYHTGRRKVESDRANACVRLRKARPGKAPWSTFTFQYREQAFLEAAGLMTPAQNQPESMFIANAASTLLGNHPAMSDPAPEPETSADSVVYTGDTPQASNTPNNADEEPETLAARNVARLEYLHVEVKQLQAQAEEARKHRVEVEASAHAITEQARLQCEQAVLQHQIADEKAKAAVQQVKSPALRSKSRR
ncbi:MAG: hypothetical protein Q9228_006760 [Teloschistes exilis]